MRGFLLRSILGLILAVFSIALPAAGGSYYVDSNSPDASDSGPGTRELPWKSLAAVGRHGFKPGDAVHFARGSVYTGGFVVKDAGTAAQPIVFTSYGNGAAPSFTNPRFSVLNGNVIQVKGSHVVIDGFFFHDGAQSATTKTEDVLRVGDVYVFKGADHAVIKNCEFRNSPIGIHLNSQFSLVTRNHLHDCNRPLAGTNWGPIAIMISNANNEISYNRITNYISTGGNYGADGGALEIDPRIYGDTVRNIKIHHNYSQGNQGFLEVAQAEGSIVLAYNISNDYQQFVILYEGSKCVFENNTVLRVLPKNSITDVVFTFKESGNIIRNNIFAVNSGRKVFSTNGTEVWGRSNYEGQKHYNNVYFSVDESQPDPCGLALGPGEKIADPRFVDFAKRNLHLRADSPAIDAGAEAGPAADFDGTQVPQGKAPDIGAYEFKRK